MKTTLGRFSLFGLLLSLFALSSQAGLTHRYSFTADAKDSVGTADGTLEGNATILNGAVSLDGTDSTFVTLPGGLITNYSAVTIEVWATYGTNGNWPRLFDFGDTNPDTGNGRNYLFVTPHSGGAETRLVISDADPGYNHEESVILAGVQDNLGKVHIAAVVDPVNKFEGLYINGSLAAFRNDLSIDLSKVSGVYSYLGKSLYGADAYLNAEIDEVRIYDQALSRTEIGASYAAGPDSPSTDAGALGSISLEVAGNIGLGGFLPSSVSATYAKTGKISLAGVTDITYQSSDLNILRVDTNGVINAVALGSATITATYQGKQDSKTLVVVQPEARLVHRYSFGESAGSTTVKDLVGTADGTLMGGAILAGDGKVALDGLDSYVDLPNGIISSMTNATFEAWVTVNELSTWARIFDFGNNGSGEDVQGTGSTYLFLTPQASSGAVRFAATVSSSGGETPVLNGLSALPVNEESHVAVVYNPSGRIARLYVNGGLVASGTATIALKSIQDVNNWLGRSNWPDPYFNGAINEFRIYEGALSDFEIALSAATGPDKVSSATGDLTAVRLVSTNSLVLGGLAPVLAYADFGSLTNVNITASPDTTYQSSDRSVLVVSTNGIMDAVGTGSATLTVGYKGKQAAMQVLVTAPTGVPIKPIVLVHRYSFSETSGTTIKDSAGTADGTLMGTGTLGGGQLTLPGGAVGSDAGYVDLPNNIISALTNATFETWVTWTGTAFWERIFDFGNSTSGEDEQGTGDTYVFLTPLGGPSTLRFAVTHSGGGAGEQVVDGPATLSTNVETHVAVTYNFAASTARLFVNGKRVAWNKVTLALTGLNDVNVWLGRSQWGDPFFTGKYNEFRLYNGALTEAQVAASYAAGPDKLPSDEPVPTEVRLAASRSGQVITLTWSAGASAFVLQSSGTLGAQASWTTATESPTLEGSLNKVTIQAGPGSRFFRLSKP